MQLTQSVKHMQKYARHNYELRVNRCKKEDEGEYIVRAENSYGKREQSVVLNVQCK